MKSENSKRLLELLTLADNRPLTQDEQAMLRDLLNDEENRLAASALQHLQTHYQIDDIKTWSADELNHIAKNIGTRVANQSQRRIRQGNLQLFAGAVAGLLIALALILTRPFQAPTPIEPAIVPTNTAVPLPTPTLRPNYIYADLLTAPTLDIAEYAAVYPLTVSEAMQLWNHGLYLPIQTLENWELIGATVNSEDDIFEIAFVQQDRGFEFVWILSQAPLNGRSPQIPLLPTYQPLPQIDSTNIYADEPIASGEFEAYAQQIEYVDNVNGRQRWIVYNTVTWQQDEQLFTLSMPSDNLGSMSLVATLADLLQMRQVPSR
ncbi:MAG: hypothetical protein AAF490_14900 [Chloroflexota bacterium]